MEYVYEWFWFFEVFFGEDSWEAEFTCVCGEWIFVSLDAEDFVGFGVVGGFFWVDPFLQAFAASPFCARTRSPQTQGQFERWL